MMTYCLYLEDCEAGSGYDVCMYVCVPVRLWCRAVHWMAFEIGLGTCITAHDLRIKSL